MNILQLGYSVRTHFFEAFYQIVHIVCLCFHILHTCLPGQLQLHLTKFIHPTMGVHSRFQSSPFGTGREGVVKVEDSGFTPAIAFALKVSKTFSTNRFVHILQSYLSIRPHLLGIQSNNSRTCLCFYIFHTCLWAFPTTPSEKFTKPFVL